MARWVLLRHDGFDDPEDWHHDWFFEAPAQERLVAFRTRAHPLRDDVFDATRLPDHRALYLEYEGAISPGPNAENRGRVTRLARGQGALASLDPVVITLDDRITLEGTSLGGDAWRFRRVVLASNDAIG